VDLSREAAHGAAFGLPGRTDGFIDPRIGDL